MKVFFDTVGCRLNQAEIEHMAAQFRAAGHVVAESPKDADLVIVNSCAVTAAAASDSRQKARQASRAGAREVIFTGCLATLQPENEEIEGVSKTIPNSRKMSFPSLILGNTQLFDLEPMARQPLPGARKRTRAFIKAQDGCDNMCTFCVTRLARGKSVSVPRETILQDILAAEAGGTHEAVLTGVNLGAWGRDFENGHKLYVLVRYLLENSSVERIRFSSLEPWDLDEEFFRLWEDERVCRHLHLPLQSGSSSVLRRMARKISPHDYRELVRQARGVIPDLAVTTDIIVGFPGETDEEFAESLEFVREIGFSDGHVFRFSSREGTAAAKMPVKVDGRKASSRSRQMREALAASARTYAARFSGRALTVLWETSRKISANQWLLRGLTDNYLQVTALSSTNRSNMLDRVLLTSTGQGSVLEGEIIENSLELT